MRTHGCIIAAILANFAFWLFLRTRLPEVFQENGPMENFQALCLLLAVSFSVIKIYRTELTAQKIFYLSLALFCASVLVLEVDFRKMNAPVLNKIMNGNIRNIWLGGVWIVALILFVKHMRSVLAEFTAWWRTPAGKWMILAGVFWVVSALIDKSLLGTKDLFREELMEVNATLLMSISGMLALRSNKTGAMDLSAATVV